MFNIKNIALAVVSTIALATGTVITDAVTSECNGTYPCRPLSDVKTEADCKTAGGKWNGKKCLVCYE